MIILFLIVLALAALAFTAFITGLIFLWILLKPISGSLDRIAQGPPPTPIRAPLATLEAAR